MDTKVNTEDKKFEYASDAVKKSEEIKQQAYAHQKLTEESNIFSKQFRMIQSGMYSKSDLEKFLSLSPSKFATSGTGNGILKAEVLSYIKKIQEIAQSQTDSLKDFDTDVRYEDIKNNYDEPATKENYDFAEKVYNQMIKNGDNGVTFSDVLAEVQSGNIS